MIIGSFIGHSVKSLEARLGLVRKLEGKVLQVKQALREKADKAIADRSAAIAELKDEWDAIGGILRRL